MKKLFFFFYIYYLTQISFAQSVQAKNVRDSLWGVWTNAELTEDVRGEALLICIEESFIATNLDTAIFYANVLSDFTSKNRIVTLQSKALNIKGRAQYFKNEHDYAIITYKESADVCLAAQLDSLAAKPISNIGSIYQDKGEYFLALDFFKKALAIDMQYNNLNGIGSDYNNLGIIHLLLSNSTGALDYFSKALKIRKETNNDKEIARVNINIGVVLKGLGRFAEALACFEQSLAVARKLKDVRTEATALNNIGLIYNAVGNYSKAKSYFIQSLQIQDQYNNVRGQLDCYGNLGNASYKNKNYTEAEQYYSMLVQLAEELDLTTYIYTAYNNLGLNYLEQKKFDLAIKYFKKTLDLTEKLEIKSVSSHAYANISEAYFQTGEIELAFKHGLIGFDLAVDIGDLAQVTIASEKLFRFYHYMGQIDTAYSYLNNITQSAQVLLELNYFALTENEKENYIQTLMQSFDVYFDFSLSYQQTYPSLKDTSFNLALKTKGLTLKSTTFLRSTILSSGDSTLLAKYETWLAFKKELSDLNYNDPNFNALENKADQLEKQLIEKSNTFSDFDKIKNLDWKEVQASLKPNECAIEFVHFKSEIDTTNPIIYAALIVKPESEHPDMVRLCTEDELKKIIGTFQGNNLSYVTNVYGSRTKANKALYEKVWQPLEPFLEGVKNIYYSPSGLLHKISFAALSKDNNAFLCDNYNLEQKSSTGNLAFQNVVTFGELENFLLMGGVNYNTTNNAQQTWSYLPGSLQETETINSFLIKKKFGVNYFKENNATESVFKEKISSSSIVHIATHGFFFPDPEQVREEMKSNDESTTDIKFRGTTNYANWSFVNNKNPLMRSGIVLANANSVWEREPLAEGEDGIVTAQEVSNMDLRNTKLVVLSACETGLGDIKGSEGVYGLQRAFKMAGVKYIIMSLWQVPDKETSEFMTLFYKNLIKLKNIPAAFRKTQKVMRAKYDPYYWGAFVLVE